VRPVYRTGVSPVAGNIVGALYHKL